MDFFVFNDTATTEIYTLSLHDALPILFGAHYVPLAYPILMASSVQRCVVRRVRAARARTRVSGPSPPRSEEHTSVLQSRQYLVFRLLLEKKSNHLCKSRSLFNKTTANS